MAAKKTLIAVRISVDGLAYIDDLAAKSGVKRSEMIRRLLGEAVTARARR